MSNFWIKSQELTAFVFEQSEKAVEFVNKGLTIAKEDVAILMDCINNSDVNAFHSLNEKYGVI
jgi:hypothetical protein